MIYIIYWVCIKRILYALLVKIDLYAIKSCYNNINV